jgi:phosphoglycolate phosphatase-like HAD superfamily hydrolase
MHVITAARLDLAWPLMERLRVREYFDGFHTHVHNKSAMIHAIIDGMEIDKSKCAMVGDLPSDVAHAKRAGIRGIGFLSPYVPRLLFDALPENEKADLLTDSFSEIAEFMLKK